jgi:uncharacterized membrane protein YfcA
MSAFRYEHNVGAAASLCNLMQAVLLPLMLVVLLASFVQGVMGFGSGSIAMALLPLFVDVKDAVAIVAVVCLFINLRLLIQLWDAISWRPLIPLSLGAALGVPVGVYVLSRLDSSQLQVGLGIVMIIYAVVKLSPLALLDRSLSDRWGLVFGFFGGAMGAAFNVGGPPMIIYVTMKQWESDQVKATLQAYFLVISLVQVPAFAATGVLTTEHLVPILVALPVLLIGVGLGSRLYSGIGAGVFSKLMVWALGCIGAFYIVRGLLSG